MESFLTLRNPTSPEPLAGQGLQRHLKILVDIPTYQFLRRNEWTFHVNADPLNIF
ncbi:hypothetical protein O164_28770 [Pseudomonas taiwanensis SJ9]|uniref:Uncharacterized protein n=1 Tax=Pseudomonas taiwanensis SJ9 TaxID=1388762 RepID=V7D2T0_9PSED|nr:hypothetical protein O164_28770 [Pseudomonas taiwanensis SJ9]